MYPSVSGSKYERQTHDIRHQLGKFIWLTLYMLKQTLGHPQTTSVTQDIHHSLCVPVYPRHYRQTIGTNHLINRETINLWLLQLSIVSLVPVFSCLQFFIVCHGEDVRRQSIVVYSSLLTLGASFIKGSLKDVALPRSSLACIVWLVVLIRRISCVFLF